MEPIKKYVWRVLIWLTQGLNTVVLLGYPDETTSSRAWRLRQYPGWKQLQKFIDLLFGDKNHCYHAYLAEKAKLESWEKHK